MSPDLEVEVVPDDFRWTKKGIRVLCPNCAKRRLIKRLGRVWKCKRCHLLIRFVVWPYEEDN